MRLPVLGFAVVLLLFELSCFLLLELWVGSSKQSRSGLSPKSNISADLDAGCVKTPQKDPRHFLSEGNSTAILYSFPGSGNTWLRLLLEWSTNVFSGSVYDDKALLGILPGESHCDSSVSVIKAHPHLQAFKDFTSVERLPRKCAKVRLPVSKVLFLTRDPYDAFWSEYQRKKTRGKHNTGLTKRVFFRPSNVIKWRNVYQDLAHKYVAQFAEIEKFRATGVKIHLVRFEHLSNASTRATVLDKAIEFLSLERHRDTSCVFKLAESPIAHRSLDRLKRRRWHSSSANEYVTKYDAYGSREDVCAIWSIVHRVAAQNGYRTFGGQSCE
jgi:Sulfotransferase domain